MDPEDRISSRLKVSDLRLLFAVVQLGGMAKAAAQLNISQPAVSKAIAALEHTLGVRLLDRNSRGVEPTPYGRALLKRGIAIFDELRQGVNDIKSLSDPAAGDLRISCAEQIAAGILCPIIKRMSERYPRVRISVLPIQFSSRPLLPQLDNREVDLVIVNRKLDFLTRRDISRTINIEILLNDRLRLAVAKNGPWARRRKIDLAELVNERWIAVPPEEVGGAALVNAFRTRGLEPPRVSVTTFSVHLRNSLAATAGFIAVLPETVLRFNMENLQELPIDLPMPSWPVLVATSKYRSLNPVVNRFIECAREVAKSFAKSRSRAANKPKPDVS